MNGSLAMRSSRLRTLLLVLVGGGMMLSLYLLTSSQYHLKDARHLLEACQQQKDSLLAQLQVVYEQKNRVEKSLQQEKLDHRKTQEDNQKNNYLRLQVQKAKVEVDSKLSALQKEQQSLQDRYHELEAQTKDLHDQQIQNEAKRTKLQAVYEHNLKAKDEDNILLRGNLTLALQERDGLENQNAHLNNNLQQLKRDFLHYKRLYIDMNQRLKKLNEEKNRQSLPSGTKSDAKVAQLGNAVISKREEPSKGLTTTKQQQEIPDIGNNVPSGPEISQVRDGAGTESKPQRSPDLRHPLPAPNIAKDLPGVDKPLLEQHEPPVAEGQDVHAEPEVGGVGQPPPSLRQQLQPPDFGPDHGHHDEAPHQTSSTQSPAAGNQPLLPPPPPQDNRQEQQQHDFVAQHQGEPLKENQDLLSQEQKDRDTMARKPVLDKNPGQGGGLAGPDLQGNENMFIGGVPSWNHLGNMGLPVVQHQQQAAPEGKARSNNNNNRPHEEEENYPEDGDDDNAEEQDDTLHDKNVKAFQDHDFEDNDGNDHNQAKEEGIVIAPK